MVDFDRTESSSSSVGYSDLGRQHASVDPMDVARSLKRLQETGEGADAFFCEEAWFTNPLVKVEGNTKVVILIYLLTRLLCKDITYNIKSAFGGGPDDTVLVESEVEYVFARPLSFLRRKPLKFHLYNSVHVKEMIVDDMDHPTWQCYKVEEIWDFNAFSVGAHFITTPIIKVLGLFCWMWGAVQLFLSVVRSIAF